jgi:outer membrane cobalamin receptor
MAIARPENFVRPKGSVSFAWRPAMGTDASLKLSRRVGQISFGDFLSQPNLTQERENAGNPDLVPPQSWELEGQVARELGGWGKTRLRGYAHRVEDIIDIVPIGATGEGVGNLPSARRLGAESISTLQFDPLGWKGARLDATLGFVRTRVRDPLTATDRPISGTRDGYVSLEFRRDVPGSPLAWGGSASYNHYTRFFRLSEVFRSWEGPVFASLFVEHKDVAGLTVRAQVNNLLNARHRIDRFVYAGRRNTSPLLFRQEADQLIGPIFQFLVRGSF